MPKPAAPAVAARAAAVSVVAAPVARSASDPRDFSGVEPAAIRLADLQPRSRVSAHFCAYELMRSDIASRKGVDNSLPSERELSAAVYLAREVLERVRQKYGAFTPNSVFRSQALERALKGKPSSWLSTSQHTKGEACDIEIVGVSTLDLAQWAATNLPVYDQIICECYDQAQGPNSGWVHISIVQPGKGTNRRALLSYIKDPASGKLVYVNGLRGSP